MRESNALAAPSLVCTRKGLEWLQATLSHHCDRITFVDSQRPAGPACFGVWR